MNEAEPAQEVEGGPYDGIGAGIGGRIFKEVTE